MRTFLPMLRIFLIYAKQRRNIPAGFCGGHGLIVNFAENKFLRPENKQKAMDTAKAKVIAERMDIDVADVKPESTFADLKIDSLDTVDMVMELEDILGIEIDLDQPVATVADLDRFIQSKVQK